MTNDQLREKIWGNKILARQTRFERATPAFGRAVLYPSELLALGGF